MLLCNKPKKDGTPCQYRISETMDCPHHGKHPERARAFQQKGTVISKEAQSMPDMVLSDLTTEDGIAKTLQEIARMAAKRSNANLKRLAEIRQCCSVAVGLRQTAATRELNRTLLKLEHGERAVMILQNLKEAQERTRLPGKPGRSRGPGLESTDGHGREDRSAVA